MSKAGPQIKTLLVTQLLAAMSRVREDRMSKIIVQFEGGDLSPRIEDVESVHVRGPSGYNLEIAVHEMFDHKTSMNGFKIDRWTGGLAFERYLQGFLENGEYTVEVRFRNGHVATRSRTLHYDDRLVTAYLENRTRIQLAPGATTGVEGDGRVSFSWTTLASLGGPDAFYCLRVCEGFSWPFLDPDKTVYTGEALEPGAQSSGLNLGVVRVPLNPASSYTWFTEILDSNRLEEINVAILMPSVRFTTRPG